MRSARGRCGARSRSSRATLHCRAVPSVPTRACWLRALPPAGAIEPEAALRGRWPLRGERGHVDLAITMAPTVPPLVQTLDVESVLPPSGILATLAGSAAALASEPRL